MTESATKVEPQKGGGDADAIKFVFEAFQGVQIGFNRLQGLHMEKML